jgi:hypothetical protein
LSRGTVFGFSAALGCFLILASLLLSSQSSNNSHSKDYALIYGTVWGPDDHPVAGVPIKIRRSQDKKPKWELTSDNNGEFALRVPPGGEDYVVQADIKMPKGQPKPETTVHIDDDERKDVSLHLTKEELSHK